METMTNATSVPKSIADEILDGLTDFVEALESGNDLDERFTCHRVKLDLLPETYNGEKVKMTRRLLKVSQALFAKFLGVSVKTVRSWEQGLSEPAKIACRFMDEIQREPAHYRMRLAKSLRHKSTPAEVQAS